CRNKIYELYECAWHRCPLCFKRRDQLTPSHDLTMAESYQRTLDRRKYLEDLGYQVIEKWEHELRSELKRDKAMETFFANAKIMDPLDAREAFYGGRTNATVLDHKVN